MKPLLTALLLSPALFAATLNEVPAGGQLKEPFGTEFSPDGTAFTVEMVSGNRLFQHIGDGTLRHLAGQLTAGNSGDGGPALDAQFNGPHNLAVLANGDILIGDTWNGTVRKYDVKAKTISTLPGWKAPQGKERGNGPYCITLSPDQKTLHIANLSQVMALDLATSTSKVIAGTKKKGIPQDGAIAAESPLVDPRAVAQDSQGNIYILERGGNALRVVDPAGKIKTVVNAAGTKGNTGDNGPALAATMNGPKHLCIDIDDSVLIADAENHVIRRYDPKTGIITRIAGTGKHGGQGAGGDPLQCQLARPHGVSVHPVTKEIWITDTYNNRVLKLTR